MTKCDIIFSKWYYFLECYWSGCRPIVNSKPKWLNPLKAINPHDWTVSLFRQGQNTLSGMEPPSRYSKIYSVKLHRSEGKHAPLGACHTHPHRQTLLHGLWWPTNHADDSKDVLAKSITSSLLKEIITYKKCRKHAFDSQIKLQVLSLINQFKNKRFI